MALDRSVANKIASAKTSTTGNKLRRGNYVLVIERILCQKKYKGQMFIPEFYIEESQDQDPNPEAPDYINKATACKAGTDASQAWPLDKPGEAGDAARGNIKQFGCALLGLDPENVTEDEVVEKLGPYVDEKRDSADALRARGMVILCQTYDKKIEKGVNAGKWGSFPKFVYVSPGEGNSPEKIAERKAKLDSEKK